MESHKDLAQQQRHDYLVSRSLIRPFNYRPAQQVILLCQIPICIAAPDNAFAFIDYEHDADAEVCTWALFNLFLPYKWLEMGPPAYT